MTQIQRGWQGRSDRMKEALGLGWQLRDWILFLHISRKVLSTFQTICPILVQFAQTVVNFAHFQVQARKRGVFGWGWGCFVFVNIQESPKRAERGLWRLSKEQGFGVVFWAKWDQVWAKWDPSGQFVRKVGQSALELGSGVGNSLTVETEPGTEGG